MKFILKIITVLIITALAAVTGVTAEAEAFGNYSDKITEALPPEASEQLSESEITPENAAEALTVEGVFGWLKKLFSERFAQPLKLLAALCGISLLCTLAKTAADNSGNMSGVFSAVGVLAGAGMTAAAFSTVISDTLEVLKAASDFMLIFVPAYTAVIAAMGKITAASAANALTLGAAQFFSQLAVNFLPPVCGTVLGLSVTGAICPELNISKIAQLVKKIAVWSLSLIMTVFMSILSAQTFVKNTADNVLIKTAKFAVSNGVPIVGGTISDAVNTVSASLTLLHSGIGTYGIIAAAVIIIPPLVTVICYRLALSAAEAVSGLFGIKELSELFGAAGWVMSVILAVIACFLLLNTVSVVIMIAIGS